MKIDPAAWFRGFNPPLPDGYTIRWKVLPMFADTYRVPKVEDPTREKTITVVQGIPNTRHTLEIVADNPPGSPLMGQVRIYKPPLAAD